VNTPTVPPAQKRRLQAHFGFTGLPFRKNVKAHNMFDSHSQRELRHGLHLWLEVRGLGIVTGPSGVGKSISLRRFVAELPNDRFAVHRFGQIPTTPLGFLRALARQLDLRPRLHLADLFEDIRTALARHQEEHGVHPVLVLDDAEGMRPGTLDLVRRLTAHDLDGTDPVSILLVGTEGLLDALRDPILMPLRTRFQYAHQLRPFGMEDARNDVRHHLTGSGAPDQVFTDGATTALFAALQGVPRQLNQLALQALITAVVHGTDSVDASMMKRVIQAHPLYAHARGG
jgi:type II secretory pathway predicted ATPase ExeA